MRYRSRVKRNGTKSQHSVALALALLTFVHRVRDLEARRDAPPSSAGSQRRPRRRWRRARCQARNPGPLPRQQARRRSVPEPVVALPAVAAAPRVYARTRYVWIRPEPDASKEWIGYLWTGGSVALRSGKPVFGPGCMNWYAIEPRGYVCVDGNRATLDAKRCRVPRRPAVRARPELALAASIRRVARPHQRGGAPGFAAELPATAQCDSRTAKPTASAFDRRLQPRGERQRARLLAERGLSVATESERHTVSGGEVPRPDAGSRRAATARLLQGARIAPRIPSAQTASSAQPAKLFRA